MPTDKPRFIRLADIVQAHVSTLQTPAAVPLAAQPDGSECANISALVAPTSLPEFFTPDGPEQSTASEPTSELAAATFVPRESTTCESLAGHVTGQARTSHVTGEAVAPHVAGEALPPHATGQGHAPHVNTPSLEQATLRDVRLFRAALADTFDAVVQTLIRDLAVDVLGRELRLAPTDIGAIVQRLLAENAADEPLRVRVAPADAHIVCELPTLADANLEPGDAILECRSGDIDARLRVRLTNVLGAQAW